MIDAAPEGVEVQVVHPSNIGAGAELFQLIIVTGFNGLDAEANRRLAFHPNVVVWAHDMESTGHGLYQAARKLILLTPTHLNWEFEANPGLRNQQISLNPGKFDTSLAYPEKKENFALWAHRGEAHKGLDLAQQWANEAGVPLEVHTNTPWKQHMERKRKAKYFVLLSHIRDPGPLAVMEAQLCDCSLIINDKVGIFPVTALSRELFRENVDRADEIFWEDVLS